MAIEYLHCGQHCSILGGVPFLCVESRIAAGAWPSLPQGARFDFGSRTQCCWVWLTSQTQNTSKSANSVGLCFNRIQQRLSLLPLRPNSIGTSLLTWPNNVGPSLYQDLWPILVFCMQASKRYHLMTVSKLLNKKRGWQSRQRATTTGKRKPLAPNRRKSFFK